MKSMPCGIVALLAIIICPAVLDAGMEIKGLQQLLTRVLIMKGP